MFAKRVDPMTTPIEEANRVWQRLWLGEREIRKFLAYTGLTAPPYRLSPENFLRGRRGMTAGKFMRLLQRYRITWSLNKDVVRRGVLQAIGYKRLDIEELEQRLVFASGRR